MDFRPFGDGMSCVAVAMPLAAVVVTVGETAEYRRQVEKGEAEQPVTNQAEMRGAAMLGERQERRRRVRRERGRGGSEQASCGKRLNVLGVEVRWQWWWWRWGEGGEWCCCFNTAPLASAEVEVMGRGSEGGRVEERVSAAGVKLGESVCRVIVQAYSWPLRRINGRVQWGWARGMLCSC